MAAIPDPAGPDSVPIPTEATPLGARAPEQARPRLPLGAYTPGQAGAPDREPLEAAKRTINGPMRRELWAHHTAYRYGAKLCTDGFFWEAHEVWEAVWLTCAPNSAERHLLRGLIQIANAALKLRMGRPAAARRLFVDAGGWLAEARRATDGQGSLLGIDLDLTERSVAALATRLAAVPPPAAPALPLAALLARMAHIGD